MWRLLLVPAMAAAATGTAGFSAGAAEIEGDWDTDQGPVTFTRRDDGSYAVDFKLKPGKVAGTLDGDELRGTWIRDSGQRCETEMEGSPFWGKFRVTFYSADVCRGPDCFTGYWTFCADESLGNVWSGDRAE